MRHIQSVHLEIREHQCTQCPYESSSKYHLDTHNIPNIEKEKLDLLESDYDADDKIKISTQNVVNDKNGNNYTQC